MIYEIENQHLRVTDCFQRRRILFSQSEIKTEGNISGRVTKATWTDKGPNLFPYIGRMTNKSYTYKGKTYSMDIHGFLMNSEMDLVEHTADRLIMKLESSEATRAQYPFEFKLEIPPGN